MKHPFVSGVIAIAGLTAASLRADDAVNADLRVDEARAIYGLDGAGVIVALLDRGIDYTHPDFRNPDGTTRILWMLDMSGATQISCPAAGPGIEYSRAQINAALASGTPLGMRDAIGHGTVSAGLAAGDGSASPGQRFAGVAPNADLIIVKIVSEGAFAHDGQPAETSFEGCVDDALDWLDQKIILENKPCVALMNYGVQWGPLDGTSAPSEKIEQVFGLDRPGRVYVASSGDEGNYPTHARASFALGAGGDAVFSYTKSGTNDVYFNIWYSGGPAAFTLQLPGGGTVGPVMPGSFIDQGDVAIYTYEPGQAFYAWRSSGPDRCIGMHISGHVGSGALRFTSLGSSGVVDAMAPDFSGTWAFTSHLVPGRLTDFSTAPGSVVAGCHVARNNWIDIDGIPRSFTAEGSMGQLWLHSSGGPTRDGRLGIDLTSPGQNSFAAYAPNSVWALSRFNLHQDGSGLYGAHGATSASGPITLGAVALLLQHDPTLTARRIKEAIHQTARADAFTGPTPNNDWGYGKLDVLGVLNALSACPADLNGDGIIDFGDYLEFLNLFDAQDPRVDYNMDGIVDFSDYLEFLNHFDAGC